MAQMFLDAKDVSLFPTYSPKALTGFPATMGMPVAEFNRIYVDCPSHVIDIRQAVAKLHRDLQSS